MTTYYVGAGGNDGNAGTSWALRKATLNGAEDIPVAAGDIVYVGAGVYRETLTCDVSGSAGSPITYIGDYTGAATDGVGGVVRITGSDNDQTATRNNAITASSKNYRTFRGFAIDMAANVSVFNNGGSNWTIDQCAFFTGFTVTIQMSGAISACTIQNCYFRGLYNSGNDILFSHSSTVSDSGHKVENCIIEGSYFFVRSDRVGGITCRNNAGMGGYRVGTALAAGQTLTVNNCLIYGCQYGFFATVLGELVENYNSVYAVGTARTNVGVGANSNTYPPLFDKRWFFEAVNGGSMVTPFDLASYSQLINLAGTSPTTTDMRGTSVIGAQREWGALEFDSTLDVEAGSGGGGPVRILPIRGSVG